MARKAARKPTRQTEPSETPERLQQRWAAYSKSTSDGVPVNRDAEQAVLGSMMLDPSSIDDVLLMLSHDDFWGEDHREIFAQLAK